METIVLNKNEGVVPDISLIVVFPHFPNSNVKILLDSSKNLKLKYEVILVVNKIVTGVNAKKALMFLFEDKPNLTSLRLVLMGSNADRSAAFGRNLGAVLAGSPILVFVDDDSVILDDLTSLVKRLQNGECYGIQPLILKLTNMGIIDSAGDFIRRTKKMYEPQVKGAGVQLTKLLSDLHLEEVPSLRGAFMLVRKDAFLAVGGMDNTFIFNFEDVDLGWRMTCAGFTLLFDPHIKELHKGSRTTRAPELISEKVFRLGLLNRYALNLKINGFHLWPYIVIQFQRYMLLYEFAGVKTRRVTAFKLIENIFKMENCFFKRFQQARIHKSILSKKFKFRGRQKLERMTHGERFLRN